MGGFLFLRIERPSSLPFEDLDLIEMQVALAARPRRSSFSCFRCSSATLIVSGYLSERRLYLLADAISCWRNISLLLATLTAEAPRLPSLCPDPIGPRLSFAPQPSLSSPR